MNFNQWLSLYKNAAFAETKVCLLSYLEQGNVSCVKRVSTSVDNSDIINSVLKRVYSV